MITPVRQLARRVRLSRRDRGRAVVEFVFLGVLLLVPLIYLVMVIGRIQAAAFAVSTAAREPDGRSPPPSRTPTPIPGPGPPPGSPSRTTVLLATPASP